MIVFVNDKAYGCSRCVLARIGALRQCTRMSSKRLDAINDYNRAGYRLRIDCRGCNRVVVMEPLELMMTCQRRGWSMQVAQIEHRLCCSKCGSRDVRCGPAFR